MSREPQQFDTVLVANRGEIACRILRTVRAMGLASVAVYSDADADAPHVRLADQAVCIGPPPTGESYLNIDRVLRAARDTGADAIHPGYGFLSENSDFATACAQAGVVFIGPSPQAIRRMGNKAQAKRLMLAAGVPGVPGYDGEDQADTSLIAAGATIGFPVMVKAAAGGGGRGMRLVPESDDLAAAIELARSEARNAFGSDELILEKAIVEPRHVEIQVIADSAGHTLYLGERDCSLQRRHQKIIEEAPCPVLTPTLRQAMGEAAVRAAMAIDYCGAGTVEFLLDAAGNFFFLEMNTRLQVEHPVTELVTGLDLVELQIRIARGETLGYQQDDIDLSGHAIEARLYTEDPARDFAPTTGLVELWQPPAHPDVRVDDGIHSGQEISPYYDAMVAKIIAWGPTRDRARRRLIAALEDTVLFGPRTNREFLIRCLGSERFARGEATTAFVTDEMRIPADGSASPAEEIVSARDAAMASVIFFRRDRQAALRSGPGVSETLCNWSNGIRLASHYRIDSQRTTFDVVVQPESNERYRATVGDSVVAIEIGSLDAEAGCLTIDGVPKAVTIRSRERDQLWIAAAGSDHLFSRRERRAADDDDTTEGGRVSAPMHGVILELAVEQGAQVDKGQRLLVMEAMKMQQEVLSPVAGIVENIHVRVDQQIASGDPLVTVEPRE